MIKHFEIRVGERYRYYGKPYEIIDIRDERVHMRSTDRSRTNIQQSYSRLQATSQRGNFIKFQEAPTNHENLQIIDALPEKRKLKLEFRKKYVDAVLKEFNGRLPKSKTKELILKIAGEINDPNPPGYTSIYKWATAYKHSNRSIFSLVGSAPKRKPRIDHWPPEIKALFNHYLDLFYLKPEHASISEVIDAIRESATAINESRPLWDQLKIPSTTTLYRIIKEFDQLEIDIKQKGLKKAIRIHKFSRKYSEPLRAYELSEDDNHTLDVIATDKYGRPIGKPYLTGILFTAPRFVAGYDLSFNAPSLAKTIRALKHSLRNDRENTGLADRYIFDNGPEFKSPHLIEKIELLGATASYCAPYTPEQKPHIERWFNTLAIQFTHKLKGTTLSNPEKCGDYDSEMEAVYTLDEIKRNFDIFIDNYHNRPHSALNGLSPKQALLQMQASQFPPRRYTPTQLDDLFRSQTYSCVVNGRVRYNYLQWTGPGVAKIGSLLKKKSGQSSTTMKANSARLSFPILPSRN